jgi:hypothetical protein
MTLQTWYQQGQDFDDGLSMLEKTGLYNAELAKYRGVSYVPHHIRLVLEEKLNSISEQLPWGAAIAKEPLELYRMRSEVNKKQFEAEYNNRNPNPQPAIPQYDAAKQLLKERTSVRAKIRHSADKATRYALAEDLITRIAPALDAVYAEIHTYEKTGELPITHYASPITDYESGLQEGVSKMLKLKSLEPRVSKLKVMIPKCKTDSEREKYTTELTEKQAEIKAIRTALGLDDEEVGDEQ